uniref:hypothetical protein n=1 Tax=Rhodococcus erythropolis TaxID=1833 RepID=UPI00117AA0FB|nr:hypothetical protein [Rhodococcus erythropolis]
MVQQYLAYRRGHGNHRAWVLFSCSHTPSAFGEQFSTFAVEGQAPRHFRIHGGIRHFYDDLPIQWLQRDHCAGPSPGAYYHRAGTAAERMCLEHVNEMTEQQRWQSSCRRLEINVVVEPGFSRSCVGDELDYAVKDVYSQLIAVLDKVPNGDIEDVHPILLARFT